MVQLPPPLPNYAPYTVQSCGLQLAVGHWPGPGRAAVLVHGLTANHLYWQPIAQALQAAGYDVHAPDLRGRGGSSKPLGPYGVEVHAQDIEAVLAHIGRDDTALIGHSLGATIALEVAATRPQWVHRLVLIDGAGVIPYSAAAKAIQAIKPALARLGRVYPDAEAYVAERRAAVPPVWWGDVLERCVRYEIEAAPGGGVRCKIPRAVIEAEFRAQGGATSAGRALRYWLTAPRYMARRTHKRTHPPYGQVQAPTLVLRAGKPNLVPGDEILPSESYQRMLQTLPNAQGLNLPHANHYSIQLLPDAARDAALLDFLATA